MPRTPWELKKNARTFCSRACLGIWNRVNNRRYEINLERLQTWSADLAYFLGLFAADGNVQSESGQVSFVSIDEVNTRFVADFLARGVPVRQHTTSSGKTAHRVSVWSKDVVAALRSHGIGDRKSFTVRMPVIPAEFRWSFVRGFLDGDGYVNTDGRIEFSTASPGMAQDLIGLFEEANLRSRLFVTKKGYQRISLKIDDATALGNLIYADGGPYLARKRSRFRNLQG